MSLLHSCLKYRAIKNHKNFHHILCTFVGFYEHTPLLSRLVFVSGSEAIFDLQKRTWKTVASSRCCRRGKQLWAHENKMMNNGKANRDHLEKTLARDCGHCSPCCQFRRLCFARFKMQKKKTKKKRKKKKSHVLIQYFCHWNHSFSFPISPLASLFSASIFGPFVLEVSEEMW